MREEGEEAEDAADIAAGELCSAIEGELKELLRRCGRDFLVGTRDGAARDALGKGCSVSALHLAASRGQAMSMQGLVSAGADPERRAKHDHNALHSLISRWPRVRGDRTGPCEATGRAEACLRVLCQHGADVNAAEGCRRQTPIHLAVQHRAGPAIPILARWGADVNAVDSAGMAPLHMACGMLDREAMHALIQQGAKVNVRGRRSGNTPLHLAAMATLLRTPKTPHEGLSCVAELLEHGAKPDGTNEAGMTAFLEACGAGNEALADLLLNHGADVNKLNAAGQGCLFLFLDRGPNVRHGALLIKLLSLASPLTLCDHKGRLPLALTLPCFCQQRELLLGLSRQPRRLQDLCKSQIYLKHGLNRLQLRKTMPERMYDFVFNAWENTRGISFESDTHTDTLDHLFEHMSS